MRLLFGSWYCSLLGHECMMKSPGGTELASEDKPQDVSSTTTDSGLITTCTSEKETQFSDVSQPLTTEVV